MVHQAPLKVEKRKVSKRIPKAVPVKYSTDALARSLSSINSSYVEKEKDLPLKFRDKARGISTGRFARWADSRWIDGVFQQRIPNPNVYISLDMLGIKPKDGIYSIGDVVRLVRFIEKYNPELTPGQLIQYLARLNKGEAFEYFGKAGLGSGMEVMSVATAIAGYVDKDLNRGIAPKEGKPFVFYDFPRRVRLPDGRVADFSHTVLGLAAFVKRNGEITISRAGRLSSKVTTWFGLDLPDRVQGMTKEDRLGNRLSRVIGSKLRNDVPLSKQLAGIFEIRVPEDTPLTREQAEKAEISYFIQACPPNNFRTLLSDMGISGSDKEKLEKEYAAFRNAFVKREVFQWLSFTRTYPFFSEKEAETLNRIHNSLVESIYSNPELREAVLAAFSG